MARPALEPGTLRTQFSDLYSMTFSLLTGASDLEVIRSTSLQGCCQVSITHPEINWYVPLGLKSQTHLGWCKSIGARNTDCSLHGEKGNVSRKEVAAKTWKGMTT